MSPIIADGTVILLRDVANDAKIIAVDLATGSRKWERSRLSQVSYGTPVVWVTPDGKQVVAPGHARLISYDLDTGAEKWSITGIPSGCCSSPVAAEGMLLFAGGSPGGEANFKMPSFDDLLKQLDKDGDGAISKAEAQTSQLKDFFDNQDLNKDGKLTRDEWDVILKFMAEGKNCAFAVKAGGTGDITKTHVLWRKAKGLPHVPSAAMVYRGQYVMVKDGGIVTAYRRENRQGALPRAPGRPGPMHYALPPVAANGHIYFTSQDDGAVTVLKAGAAKPVVVARNPKLGERASRPRPPSPTTRFISEPPGICTLSRRGSKVFRHYARYSSRSAR